jgi:hypothetical protein
MSLRPVIRRWRVGYANEQNGEVAREADATLGPMCHVRYGRDPRWLIAKPVRPQVRSAALRMRGM